MASFKGIVLALMAAVALFATDMQASAQSRDKVIRVRGSDAMTRRVDGLAQTYMKNHRDVYVVVSGGAKAIGLPELLEGGAEVAMAARRAGDSERQQAAQKGVQLVERLMGYGGIIVLAHPSNPVTELTLDQVRRIFRGEITNWNQVGGPDERIEVHTIDDHHLGTLTFMQRDFLGAPFVTGAVPCGSFYSLFSKVSAAKGAIGYSRLRDVLEPQFELPPLKVMKLKKDESSPGVAPGRAATADGTYPFRRPFYLYLDGKSSPEVQSFVEFLVQKSWGPQQVDVQ